MTVQRIIISRTDSIGDVLLTLPICAWIKEKYPNAHIIFLGKNYTKSILEAYQAIDEVCDWSEFENLASDQKVEKLEALNADTIIHVFPNKEIASLAKKAKIAKRIGTSHRSFHLLTCNYKVNFSRKRSSLHESQLNFELLRPLGLKIIPTLEEISQTTTLFQPERQQLPQKIEQFISEHPNFVVLHPKSQGSALEWPIQSFVRLARLLNEKDIAVIYTGTEKEGVLFRGYLTSSPLSMDTTGMLSLKQLLTLIDQSNGIVACSTGPLHIGAFLSKKAIGLYSSRKPIHPGRWQPIGKNSQAIVFDKDCPICAKQQVCKCIENISPQKVMDAINSMD